MSNIVDINELPKDRDFLGLVENDLYWEIFYWATMLDGVFDPEFTDRDLNSMPDIIEWAELPPIRD